MRTTSDDAPPAKLGLVFLCDLDAGADGDEVVLDDRMITPMQMAMRGAPTIKTIFDDLQCGYCGCALFSDRNKENGSKVLSHPVLTAYAREQEKWFANLDHMTICPNNAKIWILEPDMVTLREI